MLKRMTSILLIMIMMLSVFIIAPVSSWAAAVSSSLPEGSTIDGFSLFLQTIPFNLYALLTLAMVIFIALSLTASN